MILLIEITVADQGVSILMKILTNESTSIEHAPIIDRNSPEIILEKKSESFSESLLDITDTIIDRCLDEKLCEHTLELLAFAW